MRGRLLFFVMVLMLLSMTWAVPVGASEVLKEPMNLSASTDRSGGIEVSWDAVSGAKSYRVYRLDTGGPNYFLLAETEDTSYLDTLVSDGEIYTYSVEAVSGTVTSSRDTSGVMGYTKTPTVYRVTSEQTGPGTILLTGEIKYPEGASGISAACWNFENGQDDLTWTNYPAENGKFSFTVNTAEHGGKTGFYWVHIYPILSNGDLGKGIVAVCVYFPDDPDEELPVLPDSELESGVLGEIVMAGREYGDAVLLYSGGKGVLIDSGRDEDADNVLAILKAYGLTKVDVLLSHTHCDHCGGLLELIDEGVVGSIYTTGIPNRYYMDQFTYIEVMEAAAAAGVTVRSYPESGEVMSFGSMKISVAVPQMDFNANGSELGNNNSVWLKVTCGSTSYLTFGDGETEAQTQAMESGADLSADIMKLPHHGLTNAFSDAFAKYVSPETVIVSDFGISAEDNVCSADWAKYSKVYATSEEGTIRIRITDSGYEVNTVRLTAENSGKEEEPEEKEPEEKDPEENVPSSYIWEGFNMSPVFDAEFYLSRYPDLRAAFGTNAAAAFDHFIAFGMREARQAAAGFDPQYYANLYPDLRAAFGSDMTSYYRHYLTFGIAEGRRGSAEGTSEKKEETGKKEEEEHSTTADVSYLYGGIDYSPVFDPEYYLSRYPDLRAAFGNDHNAAFEHFITFGMNEFRSASPDFDPVVYQARYYDLQRAFGNNRKAYYDHYIIHGIGEGRSGK